MSETQNLIQRIAIVAHPQLPESIELAQEVSHFLEQHGVSASHGLLYDEGLRKEIRQGAFNILIVLGGDGTMLRAGHLCGPLGIPILGINVGRFGFLMEVKQKKWVEVLPRMLEGAFWLEKRMMLMAEQWRGGELLGSWHVLNEVVVGRGQMVRPVHLSTYVDGRHLTTYVADALIAATATGSTAYALAAGGPILPPEMRTILLVPVAPHLSIDRGIVLAEGATVSIKIRTDHQAVLCPDGQVPIGLADEDRIEVRASQHTVQFIRFQDPGYFYRNLTPHMSQNPSTGDHR